MSYDDADIIDARATSAWDQRPMYFERAHQDGRTYYRLVYVDGRGSGIFTDAQHARETIAHWRAKGWLTSDARDQRLPGDVGAVRDVEIAHPSFELPRASADDFELSGGNVEAGRKQGNLF